MKTITKNPARPLMWILAGVLLFSGSASAATNYPADVWQMYATPAEAGFSDELIAEAKAYWESTDSAAAMLVHNGTVVVAWGDYERRFLLHSARKSIMSGVYGVHIDAGTIDPSKTLAELGIDDNNFSLNDVEKQARIIDLIKARSGVYHLAAAEPAQNPKPERGAHRPGEQWCYNNWDFNALCTILEQETDTKFFEEVDRYFGKPLGMQDYAPIHGLYQYDLNKSIHPAYHIRMSARDMARFGLLYLNDGRWQDKTILSEQWVADSGHAFSDDAWGDGYGYMWWVSFKEPFRSLEMYSALGVGNQSIDVIPGADLVFVNRTNTFANQNVTNDERQKLIRLLIEAQTGTASDSPELKDLPPVARSWQTVPWSEARKRELTREPQKRSYSRVEEVAGDLVLRSGISTYNLLSLADGTIMIDDLYANVYFAENDDGDLQQVIFERDLNNAGYEALATGSVDDAIASFTLATTYYPESINTHDSLADGYLAKGDFAAACSCYEEILRLDAENTNARADLRVTTLRRDPFPVSADVLQNYAGKYNSFEFAMDDGELVGRRAGDPRELRLVPMSETTFLSMENGVEVHFDEATDGAPDGLRLLLPDGREIPLSRSAD